MPSTANTDVFYRSSYAIKKEFEPGLKDVCKRLKLSLAEVLTMLASDPQRTEAMLGELAAQHRKSRGLAGRDDAAVAQQRKELAKQIKKIDPDKLAKMMELLEQEESAGAAGGVDQSDDQA